MLPVCTNERLGLLFKVAVGEKVMPNINSSGKDDSRSYYIRWEKDELWEAYQLRYITEGSGVYEDASGTYPIMAGSMVITQPGVWHRYLPSADLGWEENYLGFRWPDMENVLRRILLSSKKPVIDIGIREELLDAYHQIYESVNSPEKDIEHFVSGMVLKLLGYILTVNERQDNSMHRIEDIIQQTCFFIKRNVAKQIDFKQIAYGHNLGYEHFRKIFKQIVGMPPGQYHLDQKVRSAKELLLSTKRSVKEISYDLGFESVYYFCRLFKKKTGVTPSQARERWIAFQSGNI